MSRQSAEELRLEQDRLGETNWRRWGPYVSERSWGTVREDYSPHGDAWDFLGHDQACAKAYRWGEDGIAGICDRYQLLVFAPAFWNGRDPILKERLFGLVPHESNHGEDVKEYYFHLDATPTHSYLRYLYKYPQAEFPYQQLREVSRQRGTAEREYELLDTGVFAEDRYFDIFIEYAKADPEDICMQIEVWNRGPEEATIHVVPQLWFRNTWSWGAQRSAEPVISAGPAGKGFVSLYADLANAAPPRDLLVPYQLSPRWLYAEAGGELLFTNNESHRESLYGALARSVTPFVKDAFHRSIIRGEHSVNPAGAGTKACLHYKLTIPAGESVGLRLRLTDREMKMPLQKVADTIAKRRREADVFYSRLHPPSAGPEECRLQRQALSDLIWTRQIYLFDVQAWLDGDNPTMPPPESRKHLRNEHWEHLNSQRILTVPDKWEYPWFAAWDLAFHCISFALVDPEFAKEQLWLLLFEQFQHPNGQIPAYEWEFSDLNPPVHAWAVWRVYCMERDRFGRTDRQFLEKCFHKLLINFAWWVNRVDVDGLNLFEGGFLGLDNITVVDRSQKLPAGMVLKQSDATGWMGMFCLNLMRIALELSAENPAYESLATKFFEHYVYIGAAMKRMGGTDFSLWSESEGFFYDMLIHPDKSIHKFRLRSLVGLIPLFAIEILDESELNPESSFFANMHWFLRNRSHLTSHCVLTREQAGKKIHLLSLVDEAQLRRVLGRVWDPMEFRSDFGLRSLSKIHAQEPFCYANQVVGYEPGESLSKMKGGNSNWRGPIWFPTTFLLIESLRKLATAYGPDWRIGSRSSVEPPVSLHDIAAGLAQRMIALFLPDRTGRRPIHGQQDKFLDPHWRDCLLFPEYFHGDTGEGLGACHQAGWTALVATLVDEWVR
jgi:hypothetical protein